MRKLQNWQKMSRRDKVVQGKDIKEKKTKKTGLEFNKPSTYKIIAVDG